jgi:protein-S-isoprenylcysteine O-methyltransferase Ste14
MEEIKNPGPVSDNTRKKILYGLLFVAVLPFLLVIWAERTDWIISLLVIEISYPGYILASCGILLMLAGIHNLLFFGKGLPMNAFPPEQYVKKGIYSVMKHPELIFPDQTEDLPD